MLASMLCLRYGASFAQILSCYFCRSQPNGVQQILDWVIWTISGCTFVVCTSKRAKVTSLCLLALSKSNSGSNTKQVYLEVIPILFSGAYFQEILCLIYPVLLLFFRCAQDVCMYYMPSSHFQHMVTQWIKLTTAFKSVKVHGGSSVCEHYFMKHKLAKFHAKL